MIGELAQTLKLNLKCVIDGVESFLVIKSSELLKIADRNIARNYHSKIMEK